MTPAASVSKLAVARSVRARNTELAGQLRAAAVDGDDARITRLLGELLRCKGLSRGQRIALQQKALLSLVQSLRSAALNDDLTGLQNRRGFSQSGTRLLDLAERDEEPAHLMCFGIDNLERLYDALGAPAVQIVVRQTANLLRDLFPSYGVYEVLGRIGRDEFAALTTSGQHPSREAVIARVRASHQQRTPALALSVGIARFDPLDPTSIDELLEEARRDMNQPASQLGFSVEVNRWSMGNLAPHSI
jgi:diguanylate cyclase (GGDEF)-like protein